MTSRASRFDRPVTSGGTKSFVEMLLLARAFFVVDGGAPAVRFADVDKEEEAVGRGADAGEPSSSSTSVSRS